MLSMRRGGGDVIANGAERHALHPHPLPPTPRQQQHQFVAAINSLLLNPMEVQENDRLGIAQQRYNAGDYRAALEHCNALYRMNPRRLENLLLLGAIYYQLREFDMCNARNGEAVAIQPNFLECFNNMANAWREKAEIDHAIQLYEHAIKNFFLGEHQSTIRVYVVPFPLQAYLRFLFNLVREMAELGERV